MGVPGERISKENGQGQLLSSRQRNTLPASASTRVGIGFVPPVMGGNNAFTQWLEANPDVVPSAVPPIMQHAPRNAGQKSSAISAPKLVTARPRFLIESYEPNSLSDGELMQEVESIALWLYSNRAGSVERVRAEFMLNAISAQLVKRGLAHELKTNAVLSAGMHILLSTFGVTSLPGLMVTGGLLGAGIELGFIEGASLYAADHPEKIPVLERLKAKLDSPGNRIMFQVGNILGIHWGAVQDFGQNIAGLGELAMLLVRYGTPVGQAYGGIKEGIEFLRDPSGYWNKQQEEAKAKREVIEGIYTFLLSIQQNPTLLIEIGEHLGVVVGAESARWFDEEFVEKQSAFDKGMTVGKIEGAILMEIVLLFIGPEILLARGASAAGRVAMRSEKLMLIIGEALEKVPVLKRLIDIRKLSKAGELEKGAKAVEEGAENFDRIPSDIQPYQWPWAQQPPPMSPINGIAPKPKPWTKPQKPKVIIGEGISTPYVPPETPSAAVIKSSEKMKGPVPQVELQPAIPAAEGQVPPAGGLNPKISPGLEMQAARRTTVSKSVPEYPQFPESVTKREPSGALKFFQENRDKYPKNIRDTIGKAKPTANSAKEIDRLIRKAQTERANAAVGRPAVSETRFRETRTGRIAEPSSPFVEATKGHTPLGEGTAFERGATLDSKGRPKNMTYTGQTKTGETVQIDDFDFETRVGKEVKMPLAIHVGNRYFEKNFIKVVDQMRRQAQFTKDWNFTKYVWEMYSPEDAILAKLARQSLDEDLAARIVIITIQ